MNQRLFACENDKGVYVWWGGFSGRKYCLTCRDCQRQDGQKQINTRHKNNITTAKNDSYLPRSFLFKNFSFLDKEFFPVQLHEGIIARQKIYHFSGTKGEKSDFKTI